MITPRLISQPQGGSSFYEIKKIPSKSTTTLPDPQKFGRGKRTSRPPEKAFAEITFESSASEAEEEDEEIAIVSEKITPKTQHRLTQLKKMYQLNMQKKFQAANKKGQFMRNGNKVVRTIINKAQLLNPLKKLEEEETAFFEDDEDLSCSLCMNSYWYKREIYEHLMVEHDIDDPEKFLKEKKAS